MPLFAKLIKIYDKILSCKTIYLVKCQILSFYFFIMFFVEYTKTQSMMFIIKKLFEQQSFAKEDITNALEIGDHTFRRYMQEIRAFFSNFNLPFELKFSREKHVYFLRKADVD